MPAGDHDLQVRHAAFSFLEGEVVCYGDMVPRPVLARGRRSLADRQIHGSEKHGGG